MSSPKRSASEAEEVSKVKTSKKRATRVSKRTLQVSDENIPKKVSRKKTKKTDDTSDNQSAGTSSSDRVVNNVSKTPKGRGRGNGRGRAKLPAKKGPRHYWARSPPTMEQWLAVHPDTATRGRGRGRSGRGTGRGGRKAMTPRTGNQYYWGPSRSDVAAQLAVDNLYDSD